MRMAPTSKVSVADAVMRAAASPPGTTWPSAAADRMAIVVVVLTLSGREVPKREIDHHRQESRVEPDLHRQAGDGRVRHRLGNHDRGCCQAGDDVRAQPLRAVFAHPVWHR